MKRQESVPAGRLIDLRELVAEYGATTWYWRSAFWSHELPAVQARKKLLFDRRDVEAFIDRHRTT
jgi:hypothetical protein